jgi:ATP-dependent Clp protease ATP-binding subunit ClpA
VPVSRLIEEETTRAFRMEEDIHAGLIGQEDAVKIVSQSVRRARAGLKDARRPIGSFIFLFPAQRAAIANTRGSFTSARAAEMFDSAPEC